MKVPDNGPSVPPENLNVDAQRRRKFLSMLAAAGGLALARPVLGKGLIASPTDPVEPAPCMSSVYGTVLRKLTVTVPSTSFSTTTPATPPATGSRATTYAFQTIVGASDAITITTATPPRTIPGTCYSTYTQTGSITVSQNGTVMTISITAPSQSFPTTLTLYYCFTIPCPVVKGFHPEMDLDQEMLSRDVLAQVRSVSLEKGFEIPRDIQSRFALGL